ncbi:MAG TPA: ferrous iron transporter B [Coriobacteriia bacterium]|nr:ferrous iron transporter B [Coriobacteriia bacterium]
MATTIALAGNPNTGKTTLFNALTGTNRFVGNWPGVTVEKKQGRLKNDRNVQVVDLPGIYSLSPYTLEEVIARNYLLMEQPDVIINIVDGSNLERNLYLTTQLLEIGIPVVTAINMMDTVRKNGDKITVTELEKQLGCKVIEISALKNEGIDELVRAAISAQADKHSSLKRQAGANRYASKELESSLCGIEALLPTGIAAERRRFLAVKVFERDEKLEELLTLKTDGKAEAVSAPAVAGLQESASPIIEAAEKASDDDSESIIINARYGHISDIIGGVLTQKNAGKESTSDKIDKVVTNRILALPIFAVVMFLVYFLAVTTVGSIVTDWANDGVFGDGWFLTGEPEEYSEVAGEFEEASMAIEAYEAAAAEDGLDPESAGFTEDAIDANLTASYETYDDEAGTNEIIEVDAAAYEEALAVEEPNPSDYGIWIVGVPVLIGGLLEAIAAADWVQGLVLDGIVAGVGAVLGFVPQMLVLFLLLALLEQCGYMARIAFILDRVFRRFGLSGKSFIPILIGTGCGVPGIMASRTIENQNDRRMTVMTTTFIPCGAKLPVIALFAGAIFAGAWWVAPSAYFLGIATILCTGIVLKKTRFFTGDAAPFLMELPAYHLPTAPMVLRSMWERARSFIKRAGTIILLAAIIVWFISGYGFTDGGFGAVEDSANSILAVLGSGIAWIFAPLGFGTWEAAAASVTGLIAKENLVSTFSILYGSEGSWYTAMQMSFGLAAAYALMAFNLLCAPCFAAMGAIRREMNNPRWTAAAIAYQCGVAWLVALWIYQFAGLLIGEVAVNPFTFIALATFAAFIYLLVRPAKNRSKSTVSAGNVAAETV